MVVSRFQGSPAASLDTPMAPQGLVCHICGRQYFKDSMPIHLEQCLEALNLANEPWAFFLLIGAMFFPYMGSL